MSRGTLLLYHNSSRHRGNAPLYNILTTWTLRHTNKYSFCLSLFFTYPLCFFGILLLLLLLFVTPHSASSLGCMIPNSLKMPESNSDSRLHLTLVSYASSLGFFLNPRGSFLQKWINTYTILIPILDSNWLVAHYWLISCFPIYCISISFVNVF